MTEFDTAESLLRLHRMTRKRFGEQTFGDPTMVMLLELLIAAREDRSVSTSGLTLAAGLPPTTGNRFIGALVDQGLIQQRQPCDDEEAVPVSLTSEGDSRLRQLLRDWQ